jgi:hypothetical protein
LRLAAIFVLCLLGLLSSGCQSDKDSKPKPWASVTIHGNTPGQIGMVTQDVFRENGYRVVKADMRHLVFEKHAGTWDKVMYGGMDPDSPVWLRVNADIVLLAETGCRLECKASLVADPGTPLEEVFKYTHINRKPVQALLDEVAQRLQPPP